MENPILVPGVQVTRPPHPRLSDLLSQEYLEFLVRLQQAFGARRRDLLARRAARQATLAMGGTLGFNPETREVRESSWQVTAPPDDLKDRRVEITGPPEAKMILHAFNSGAQVYMADFEDALSPTWQNLLQGQANLAAASRGHLYYESADGRSHEIRQDAATLTVRPRGWHLDERHVRIGGVPVSASLFDFSLHAFHNARLLREKGSGPYYYLPKMESHLEARLWNDVFTFTEDHLKLPRHTIRCTVLIETIQAAFEMEEMLYELRGRSPALNAGRWDYLFSIVKTYRERPGFVLPDRADIPMTTPFLWAYTSRLVQSCHRRGAYAIGGMAAFVPSRKDPDGSRGALDKVRADKLREAHDGFDGTWVAHPDLVPVARAAFDEVLGGRTNQLERLRSRIRPDAPDLLYFQVPSAAVTERGVRSNCRVGTAYLAAWLAGQGAVAIDNCMEDTATAEIARSQVWQWVKQGVVLEDGTTLTGARVRGFLEQETARLVAESTLAPAILSKLPEGRRLFEEVALGERFHDFLTIAGQDRLDP
ncbi:MAG: malate synthase [Thermoplasmata archaeon]|nr:malate synthase [Thermoplasmata archaeon]